VNKNTKLFAYVEFTAHRITGFLDFVYRPAIYKLENTTFRKLDLFPSSCGGKEARSLFGPSERANPNHWTSHISFTAAIQTPEIRLNFREITGEHAVNIVSMHEWMLNYDANGSEILPPPLEPFRLRFLKKDYAQRL
jgi:hypothetical protein